MITGNGYRVTDDARGSGIKLVAAGRSNVLTATCRGVVGRGQTWSAGSKTYIFFSGKRTVTGVLFGPGAFSPRSIDVCAAVRWTTAFRVLRSRLGFRLILWHVHNGGEVLRTPCARRFAFGRKQKKSPFNRLRPRKYVRYAL